MTERTRIDVRREKTTTQQPAGFTRLPDRSVPAGEKPGTGTSEAIGQAAPTPLNANTLPLRAAAEGPSESAGKAPVTQEGLIAQVGNLPALPNVVLRVMQMTLNGDFSARQIAQEIANDPNFAVRILKLANSAYYGLPRSVGTISEAVTLLGNRMVRRLAILAATKETLRRQVAGYDLEPGALWRHSIACGLAAQMLAEETTRAANPEEAFVAGLLHDIGKVVIGMYVEGAIEAIRWRMETDDCAFLEAERAELGFDHAEIGGRIAQHWNLPAHIAQAISLHHQPVQNGKVVPLAALVHVANALSLTAGMGLGADGLRTSISSPALEALQLDETKIEAALDRLVGRFAESKPLFEMEDAA